MIAILSYGLGNVRAFANIYRALDVPHVVAEDAATVAKASRIILPGVGAFDHAMERLAASGLQGVLQERVRRDRVPVLGICVGMQMLAATSEEGSAAGLDWVPGTVRRIVPAGEPPECLPHMGWNTVTPRVGEPLFAGIAPDSRFYFLHSYYFTAAARENAIASADYAGAFTCAVRADNVWGVQFHPEKSHANGVRVLRNFAGL